MSTGYRVSGNLWTSAGPVLKYTKLKTKFSGALLFARIRYIFAKFGSATRAIDFAIIRPRYTSTVVQGIFLANDKIISFLDIFDEI